MHRFRDRWLSLGQNGRISSFFSTHGYYVERIEFDASYWCDIQGSQVQFFENELSKELMTRDIMSLAGNSTTSVQAVFHEVTDDACRIEPASAMSIQDNGLNCESTCDLLMSSTARDGNVKQSSSGKRSTKRKAVFSRPSRGRKKKSATHGPVYICPVCHTKVEDPCSSMPEEQYSIMC
jgi:hypothetical protein